MTEYNVTDTVRQVMTAAPVTVHPDTTIGELLQLFHDHEISCCPVVHGDGDLHGIISKVDVLRALRPSRELSVLPPGELARQHVRDVMRYGVVSLEVNDPIVAALDLLVDTRFHALPVVRRGPGHPTVVGIVTQGDVIRYLSHPALVMVE